MTDSAPLQPRTSLSNSSPRIFGSGVYTLRKFCTSDKIKKLPGEVTEWFKVTVLKTVVGQLTASSNLALSACSKLFSELPPIRAAFSLVLRSKSQMFSWGEWASGRGSSRAFLFDRRRRFWGIIALYPITSCLFCLPALMAVLVNLRQLRLGTARAVI